MNAHVVILNYNGTDVLKRYLPLVVKAAAGSSNNVNVTVLDNRSSDNSVRYVRENFPSVNVAVSEKNLIIASYNDFLKKIQERIVILINNDAYMAEGCIDLLISGFRDDSVFAVAPKVLDAEGRKVTGGCMGFSVRAGLFRNQLNGAPGARHTLYIGNPAACDRKKFLELGGYDPIYLPGTFEDMDLCYRAWQRGWSCLYEANAVAYHQDSASFNKVYGNRRRQVMSARNAYIFVWKNIRDLRILAANIFLYPVLMLFNLLRFRFDLMQGAMQALILMPKVLARRKESGRAIVRSDRGIRNILTESF
jgi:GT2 family glycosyltransferase